jgi:hypothetical protein
MLRAASAAGVILIGAMIAGLVMNGIGVDGLFITLFAMAAAFMLLLIFPRDRVPTAHDLNRADLNQLVARTQFFMEARYAQLPPPAQQLVDRIGLGLDQLSPQLSTLGEGAAMALSARKLLTADLPALIGSFLSLPEPLRDQVYAGSTPQNELVEGLEVIARELETLTGEIARDQLDALATHRRYLEARYAGDGLPGDRSTH